MKELRIAKRIAIIAVETMGRSSVRSPARLTELGRCFWDRRRLCSSLAVFERSTEQ